MNINNQTTILQDDEIFLFALLNNPQSTMLTELISASRVQSPAIKLPNGNGELRHLFYLNRLGLHFKNVFRATLLSAYGFNIKDTNSITSISISQVAMQELIELRKIKMSDKHALRNKEDVYKIKFHTYLETETEGEVLTTRGKMQAIAKAEENELIGRTLLKDDKSYSAELNFYCSEDERDREELKIKKLLETTETQSEIDLTKLINATTYTSMFMQYKDITKLPRHIIQTKPTVVIRDITKRFNSVDMHDPKAALGIPDIHYPIEELYVYNMMETLDEDLKILIAKKLLFKKSMTKLSLLKGVPKDAPMYQEQFDAELNEHAKVKQAIDRMGELRKALYKKLKNCPPDVAGLYRRRIDMMITSNRTNHYCSIALDPTQTNDVNDTENGKGHPDYFLCSSCLTSKSRNRFHKGIQCRVCTAKICTSCTVEARRQVYGWINKCIGCRGLEIEPIHARDAVQHQPSTYEEDIDNIVALAFGKFPDEMFRFHSWILKNKVKYSL